MKEVTIKVKEEKLQFFMELLAQLDFVELEENYTIPEFHKKIVSDRLATYKTEEQFKWAEEKDNFDLE